MARLIDPAEAANRAALHLVGPQDLAPFPADWLAAQGFSGKDEQVCLLPDGQLLVGCEQLSRWTLSSAAERIKAGGFALQGDWTQEQASRLALGWALACEGERRTPTEARLIWPEAADRRWVTAIRSATLAARALIDQPANRLGPAELQRALFALAERFSAQASAIVGEELLAQNYPAIHAVGRAAEPSRAPRLLRLSWIGPQPAGGAQHKLALVGKGVCFDTGGLDLKPASAMRTMKKDMGGAATAMALAEAIMALELPVAFDLWVPAVENSVAGNAFRPGDVIDSRAGKTIEIGNTDAEGRLILVDAITRALEERPDRLIDFATLTGAARVAVGTEIAALFCNDEALAAAISAGASAAEDPCWRLPLHQPYARFLKSDVADLNNISEGPGPDAGATTAALFMERFLGDPAPAWAHFDIMAFNVAPRPGRPKGGEPMGWLAVLEALRQELAER